MPKKPSCADFIVAAIRATRLKHKDLKAGTTSGKAVSMVWSLAKRFYSEQLFRQSLDFLFKNGVLILIAGVSTDTGYPGCRLEKIPKINKDWLLHDRWWYFDNDGKIVDSESARKGGTSFVRTIRCPRLYIVADGLPKSVARIVHGSGMSKAEQIMASLQKKK